METFRYKYFPLAKVIILDVWNVETTDLYSYICDLEGNPVTFLD